MDVLPATRYVMTYKLGQHYFIVVNMISLRKCTLFIGFYFQTTFIFDKKFVVTFQRKKVQGRMIIKCVT